MTIPRDIPISSLDTSHTEQALLAAIVQATDDAIIGLDEDATITFWNRGAEALYDYPAEDILGQSFRQLVPSDRLEEFSGHFRRAWSGETRRFETQRLRRDGTRVDVSSHLNPVHDTAGRVIGLAAVNRDVSERKQMEQALLRSEERFRMMAESLPQIVWTARADGAVDYYNRRWMEYSGIPVTGGHEWGWQPILHPDDEQRTLAVWRQAVQSGEVYECEHRIRRQDGVYRWYLSRGLPLRDESGRITRWFGSATDIHDVKEAQEKIADLNARLQRSMAETHHRVKNNLQVIAALVELQAAAHAGAIPAEEVQGLGQHIRGLAAIHDLLTEQNRLDGGMDTVSARLALEKLLPMLQAMLNGRMIHALLDDTRLPTRQATALALIVNELVSNAVKHAPDGDIYLTLSAQSRDVLLTVEDQGPGFPPAFDALQYANNGLDLVLSLASWDMAGRASFTNRPEGGARVDIVFPRTVQDPEPAVCWAGSNREVSSSSAASAAIVAPRKKGADGETRE